MAPRQDGTFGTLLRQHRERAGMTQQSLAALTNLSARAIGYLEKGQTRPRRETVQLLADALALGGQARAQFEAAVRGRRNAPAGAADPPRGNLPLALTSFVGREESLAEVKALCRAEPPRRLVTLIGAGGCGKTRLALRVARDIGPVYPDGAWLVALESCATPQKLPRAVAAALKIPEHRGQDPLAVIAQWLRDKALLLILDNCEHLLEAAALLAQRLLQAAPNLQILATSRVPLRTAGEVIWRVPSLALPDAAARPTVGAVARAEAVQLLIARAGASDGTFAVTPANAAAVAQLCRRLDGLPLAIELAAAQLPVLGVEQLVARLDRAFEVLTEGNRTALPRQQTLRATLDWGHDLLAPRERTVLRRLAVFAGGFTLEAAEAVCATGDLTVPAILPLLARLVHQSLVQAEEAPEGTKRYRLLETIRQYAAGHLAAHSEDLACRRRHCAHYAAVVESVAHPLDGGPDGVAWRARVGAEMDNIRAALAWADGHDRPLGLRLASAAWPAWFTRSDVAEGRDWLRGFLDDSVAPPAWRARGLYGLAMLSLFHDLAAAGRALEEALALAKQLDDRHLVAAIHIPIAYLLIAGGRIAAAEEHLAQGWALATAEQRGAYHLLRGFLALQRGEVVAARGRLTTALGTLAIAGQPPFRCMALNWRGEANLKLGAFAGAAGDFALLREVAHACGSTFYVLAADFRLAQVRACRGDLAGAEASYADCLERAGQLGSNHLQQFLCRLELARIALYRREPARALEQLAACEALLGARRDRRAARELATLSGIARWHLEERDEAAAHLVEALDLWSESADQGGLAHFLESLAALHDRREQATLATTLLGVAATLRRDAATERAPADEPDVALARTRAQAFIGDGGFARAWESGLALPLDDALAQARAWLAGPAIGLRPDLADSPAALPLVAQATARSDSEGTAGTRTRPPGQVAAFVAR